MRKEPQQEIKDCGSNAEVRVKKQVQEVAPEVEKGMAVAVRSIPQNQFELLYVKPTALRSLNIFLAWCVFVSACQVKKQVKREVIPKVNNKAGDRTKDELHEDNRVGIKKEVKQEVKSEVTKETKQEMIEEGAPSVKAEMKKESKVQVKMEA